MSNTHKLVVLRPANGRTITITSWYDSEAKAAAAAEKVLAGETWTISTKDGAEVSKGEGTAEKNLHAERPVMQNPRTARKDAMMKAVADRKAADHSLAAKEAESIKAEEAHQHAEHVAAEEAAAHHAAPAPAAEPAPAAPAAPAA